MQICAAAATIFCQSPDRQIAIRRFGALSTKSSVTPAALAGLQRNLMPRFRSAAFMASRSAASDGQVVPGGRSFAKASIVLLACIA
jgi:hypothetical protein